MKPESLLLTKKALPVFKIKNGFSLIEVILSITLFAVMVGSLTHAIILGEQNTALSGANIRATYIAEEGLEVVRNIRDGDYANLSDGTFGLEIADSSWELSATPDVTEIFTRSIDISSIDSNTKKVVSTVEWQQNAQRTGSISLETYLTNWHHIADQSVYLVLSGDAWWSGPGAANPNLVGLELQNTAPFPITIDKMGVEWTKPIRNLKSIIINGITVYDGNAASGTVIDITDFTLQPGIVYIIDEVTYDGNMKDSNFIVNFYMKDGSGTLTTTIYPQSNI